MNCGKYILLWVLVPLCCCAEDGVIDKPYHSTLELMRNSIDDVVIKNDEHGKALNGALRYSGVHEEVTLQAYKRSRQLYKALLDSLLVEVENIDSREDGVNVKLSELLILMERGRILITNMTKAEQEFLERRTTESMNLGGE